MHKYLIGRFSILEAERHYLVALETLVGDEEGVLLIGFVKWDLIVSEYASMKLNSSCPTITSTSWSIQGKEKLFLGHAMLRFVKSIHVLHI